MRTKALLKNGVIILMVQMISYAMDFICRWAFITNLSMDYVGVKGLFSNTLELLSLTELGLGTVIVYSLYVPLAAKDEHKILALLQFYKKAYIAIACAVGGIGLLLTPFLPHLIKNAPEIDHLYTIFLLSLTNSVVSYLFSYKTALFLADQKLYVTTLWTCGINVVRGILQVIILFLTKNYLLFLAVKIPFTLLGNICLSRRAERAYPFLSSGSRPAISGEEKKTLLRNVLAMFSHRSGATILNSTDNLIISRFVGLTAVAISDTYTMILNMVHFVVNQLFSALTASVGNLNATESAETSYRVFRILHFCGFWFYNFCTTALFVLLNPFIELAFGVRFLFEPAIVAVICLNFYIIGIRKVPLVFKESMGLLWQDWYSPLLESCINLTVSIVLSCRFGVIGVYIGTTVCMLATSFWIEPYVLFQRGFGRSWLPFWRNNLKYSALSLLTAALTYFAGSLYQGPLPAQLLIKGILCLLIPNMLMFLLFHNSEEFAELLSKVKAVLPKRASDNETNILYTPHGLCQCT